jgi:hypothetical protein
MCETFGEVSVICPNFCIKLLVFLFYFDFFFLWRIWEGVPQEGGHWCTSVYLKLEIYIKQACSLTTLSSTVQSLMTVFWMQHLWTGFLMRVSLRKLWKLWSVMNLYQIASLVWVLKHPIVCWRFCSDMTRKLWCLTITVQSTRFVFLFLEAYDAFLELMWKFVSLVVYGGG